MTTLHPWAADDDLHSVYLTNADYWRRSGDLDPSRLDRPAVARAAADLAPGELAFTARHGNATVGYVRVLERHLRDGHPWIGLLLVDGHHRRQGHGRAIATAVEDLFEGTGVLRLGVLVNNPAAQRFWSALGYRHVDTRPDMAKGRTTLIYEKRGR
ncbi:hypothetical protein Aph02nite_67390 [Actinoplanes philippinensis]|uniref:Acetyltransferase (GNAT) family protein n=1 Tax=Actinoplanes philippinensis TaxID=35752 RepID=A0A1I2L2C0_9ACTN|nr:GNAT family N-acetyltransferase [Actinoplanes philippinensis]GIE80789.1 hypothetical protein Aph02nite_67390 [Actinoplanes philippinensis]SFF71597.1 Acetyltransferase (GNAT) family protein [Actinoplanes philippinensis]